MRLAFAFLSAAVVPPLLMTAWYLYGQFITFEPSDPYIWVRTGGFLWLSIIVSAGFVLLLGLPAYFLGRRFNLIRWWSTLVSGFTLAAAPMAIITWPLRYPELRTNASVNGVVTMIDGVPTMAGWMQFIEGIVFLGACGLVGALAFWLTAPGKFRRGRQ